MTSPRRAYPPAWYRDPQVDGQLRRWNGWRWTGELRPQPTWLGNARLAVGPRRRRPAALLWLGAAACFAGAVLSLTLPADDGVASGRIANGEFVAGANRLCQVTADHFARTDPDTNDRAARTEARADAWAAMASAIRGLDVARLSEADAALRDRWLGAWDQWIVEGRTYAAALAAGDDAAADAASLRSEPAKRVIDAIAVESGMPACRFLE